MNNEAGNRKLKVAISLEMDWGFNRHQETFAGCHAYAQKAGWECQIHPAPDRMLTSSGKLPFDGILARVTPDMAKAAKQAGIPIVNVWMNTPAKGVPSVFADSALAGRMAAEHLMGRGFRQFGFLGHQRDIDSQRQWNGFSEALRSHDFTASHHRFPRVSVEGVAPGWERFIARLNRWIDSWKTPIGVFVTQDIYCRYLIDVCRSKGLHVSQDVAIIGAGNETIVCDSPPPTLSSIDFGFSRIGYRAAELLDDLMRGGVAPSSPILVPPAELVPRQSTDVYAADDPMVTKALRFIAENSHHRIEVKEVVTAVATNRRSLERKFRQFVGTSIAGEITRLRLERAKRRIVETDAPMKDVALDAGFRNADHFYKVFSRVEGIPPSQFREEHQKVFLQE
ncbi:DNA transcription repressor specific for xylose [Haloferula helveola]|uniref:DNA transcription repressor specific for xylose n=1 Tax=Haloferula helveola TaxID=490095 RepID=A0ABM7R8N4_9BACT|nr:DNA transcription repressor specific for xylose [Haloferula helveola]